MPSLATAKTLLQAALETQPMAHRVIDFPRKDPITREPVAKVAIRALSVMEINAATTAAEHYAKRLLREEQRASEANLGYQTLFENAASIELLYRACRDAENLDRPAFMSPDDMRRILSMDEVACLVEAYNQMQAETSPIVSNMTSEEMDAWLLRIKEAGETMLPLYSLSSAMKNDLLMRSASLLFDSQTDSSLSGSQPEEPPPNAA